MPIPALSSGDALAEPRVPRSATAALAERAVAGSSAPSSDLLLAWQVLRVPQWLHFAVLPALPLYATVGRGPFATLAHLAPAILVAALCLAFAYGINAIADRRGDRDPAKNPLAGRACVPALARLAVLGCAALALLVSAAFSDRVRTGCAALSLIASAVYSAGPRVKSVPVIGTLANSVIFAPLALLVPFDWSRAPQAVLLLAAFVVLQTQSQLVHEAGDLAEDEGSGTTSSAVIFGPRAAMRAARVLGYAAALGFLALGGLAPLPIAAALASLAGGLRIGRAALEDAARVRRTHRWLSLVAGTILYALAVGASR